MYGGAGCDRSHPGNGGLPLDKWDGGQSRPVPSDAA
jgi:hypothetical protein